MMLSTLVGMDQFMGQDVEISGLTADSRAVKPGDIFAALPGERADGRDYIEAALRNGASAVLSTRGLPALPVPYIGVEIPRRVYAQIAAKLYPGQPKIMAAVTGTNGKSSTIEFLRQIWSAAGKSAACFGTLGVKTNQGLAPLTHTTPDAAALHQILAQLSKDGITHAGMEASSHGLKQYRLDGVSLSATGFTNLTQDHFDYHSDMDDYFDAKARLFTRLAPKGSRAVINVDSEYGHKMAKTAKAAGLDVMSVGWTGADIRIDEVMPKSMSQTVALILNGARHNIEIPLVGEFQVLNAISALGLALVTGVDESTALAAVQTLEGVAGRMEKVGISASGAPIFVDFAHTPDGLDKLLRGIRPHTQGRLLVVFGCGGDRDPDKRAKMGEIANHLADHVIVTDDNPRSEDPASIRKAVMVGCPHAENIGDRKAAIARGIDLLKAGDSLVIAGKGHESGQIVGDVVIPFNDAHIAQEMIS